MFFGGQTVTFGKVICEIGKVSMVVFTGFSDQSSNDWWINIAANVNPVKTTRTQNNLTLFLVVET